MQKKSVVILILISFWFMYTTVTIGMYVYQSRGVYQGDVERRKKLIDYYLDLSAHFLMNDNVEALLPRLKGMAELRQFDFFLLRKQNEVLGFYNKDNDLLGINHDYKVTDQFIETDRVAFKALAIRDYKITIGIGKAESTFLWRQLELHKASIIQDLILVTTMVFLIVYLILKDIVQLSKALQSRGRSSLSQIQSRSREGDILLQATKGYERTNEGLKRDNLLLASSLAPAVRSEIRSGLKPPYEFPCTLARIDLNGYTQLVLQKKPDELLHILNRYFQNSRDLIERYHGGLIYQYVGDEIIFLFKEDGILPSSVRALCAIRSLFEMAERLISPGLPNGLRLKASLVSGPLQFVKLDQGYSFSGLPLIESVRMLGQVKEKNENVLVAYTDSLRDLAPYCEPSEGRTTVFKGFETESHIVEIKKFTPLVKAFSVFPLPQIAEAYRNDQDLVGILQKLYFLLHEEDDSSFFSLIAPLRSMKVEQTSDEVVRAYTDLLSACLKMGENEKTESRRLASVMALSQNLLQKEQLDSEIENAIRKCQEAKDIRVQANSLIVQAHFDFDIEDLPQKMNSSFNRLAADAVLISGRIDFDENLFRKVREFLASPQPRFKASALYLIAALVEYHFDRDLVYLKANSFLRSLVLQVPSYLNDPDPMVQTRAKTSWAAIQKVGLYEN